MIADIETCSGLLRYRLPTLILNGNLVHFGGFRNHVGFYATPSGTEAFQEELAQYKGAKGFVRFPLLPAFRAQ